MTALEYQMKNAKSERLKINYTEGDSVKNKLSKPFGVFSFSVAKIVSCLKANQKVNQSELLFCNYL